MNQLSAGEEIAGYRVESLLGRGGMAVVYRALDTRLGRNVALKLLSPELMENEQFRLRFIRESRLAASLDHPNIIPIYEAGEAEGLLYIVMRLVIGSDLKAVIDGVPLDPQRVLHLATQACNALDVAHSQGLVHRDVKPGNILISRSADGTDFAYLTDFGLTKRTTSMSGALTRAGNFLGTIDYVAPEQIAAKPVDPRTDIYALGCVLYECFTGQLPFHRDEDAAVLWAHLVEAPPPVSAVRPGLGADVDAVVARAMAKAPEDRYSSCHELLIDLRAALALPHAVPAPMQSGDLGARSAGANPPPSAPPGAGSSAPRGEEPVSPSVHPSFPPGAFDPASGQADVPDLGPDSLVWRDDEIDVETAPPEWEAEPAWEDGTETEPAEREGAAVLSPGAGAASPVRWARFMPILAGLTLLCIVAAAAIFFVLRPGGEKLSQQQQQNQLVPLSFQFPESWTKRTDNIHYLVSAAPEEAGLLFLRGSPDWAGVDHLLASDPAAVVGLYITFSATLDDPTNKLDMQTLLPPGTEFAGGAPQDVTIAGLGAKRLDGDVTSTSGSQLRIVTYAVNVQDPQPELVLLTFFSAPSEFAANSETFDRILATMSRQ